jgi:hypothetical protein
MIAREGVVIAPIVPEKQVTGIRLGRDAGKGRIGPDFDEPLPEFAAYER